MTSNYEIGNVEILPGSTCDELIVRLSPFFSKRLRTLTRGFPGGSTRFIEAVLQLFKHLGKCPHCGETNLVKARFCAICGKPFASASPSASSPAPASPSASSPAPASPSASSSAPASPSASAPGAVEPVPEDDEAIRIYLSGMNDISEIDCADSKEQMVLRFGKKSSNFVCETAEYCDTYEELILEFMLYYAVYSGICPDCGMPTPADSRYCITCGAKLPIGDAGSADSAAPAPKKERCP